jgi:hypothetical protein
MSIMAAGPITVTCKLYITDTSNPIKDKDRKLCSDWNGKKRPKDFGRKMFGEFTLNRSRR